MNRGHVVVVSGFLMCTLFYGVLFNYNLLNIELKNTFNSSATQSALPGSIAITCSGVSAPVVTFVYQTIGHRKTIGLGVVLSCVSLLSTSFIHHIKMACFTYGLFFGLGCAAILMPMIDVTGMYFTGRYLTRALCLQYVGVSIGLMLSPCVEWLYSKYSWRVALRILTLILAVIGLPCTAVAIGNSNQEIIKKASKTPNSSKLSRYLALVKTFNYIISMPAFFMLALSVSFSYVSLGFYLETMGLDRYSIAQILSLMGVGDIIGRLFISFVSVLVPISFTMQYVVALVLSASLTLAIPFITSQTPVTVVLSGLGMTRGVLFSATVASAINISPSTLCADGVAVMFIFFGIGTFCNPYITDSLYDVTGSYQIGIFICVGLYVGAAALFTIGHIYKTRYGTGKSKHNVLEESDIYKTRYGTGKSKHNVLEESGQFELIPMSE